MLAKKTSKNQLTLPKAVASLFPDIEYFDVSVKGGRIVLTPARISPAKGSLHEIREKLKKLGVETGEVADAVRWARKYKRRSA
jgi:hypothetical protein